MSYQVRYTREGRNVMCFIEGASVYRAVNTHLDYENQSVNFVKVVVYFEIHTKHTVHWAGRMENFFNVKPMMHNCYNAYTNT